MTKELIIKKEAKRLLVEQASKPALIAES